MKSYIVFFHESSSGIINANIDINGYNGYILK